MRWCCWRSYLRARTRRVRRRGIDAARRTRAGSRRRAAARLKIEGGTPTSAHFKCRSVTGGDAGRSPRRAKIWPRFYSKRVTVPKTHFLYAVVQYTQVRTSTTVSSQSTSSEPRNLAASPQPSGRGSIQVPWRLLLRQAYAAPPSVVGRPRRRLMMGRRP